MNGSRGTIDLVLGTSFRPHSLLDHLEIKMPLWLIFHPPGTFEDEESKQALSGDITKIYTESGLPAFYVVVNFINQPLSNTYVGGVARSPSDKPFIRMVAEHIAIRLPESQKMYARVCERIDKALKPHVADKGYDWEYHCDETERGLWKINGIIPPPWKSEEEKVWVRENRPIPWESKL